nr:zinc finger, CCHC-type, retrotransposon Gag domain protein [Tanacetum cinerariifolium]
MTLLPLCHVYLLFYYVISCLYIRSLSVMLTRISFHVLYGRWLTHVPTPTFLRPFRTPCRHCFPRFAYRFARSSGPSDSGGNPPPVTIHTWLERFNKQKPRSFEKATAPVDAKNWISHMEKIFDVMGCEDAFKTRLAVYKFEGSSGLRRFFRYAMFIYSFYLCYVLSLYLFTERYAQPYFFSCIIRQRGVTIMVSEPGYEAVGSKDLTSAGTEEEHAKNFKWGLRRNSGYGRDQRNRGHQSNRSANSGNSS